MVDIKDFRYSFYTLALFFLLYFFLFPLVITFNDGYSYLGNNFVIDEYDFIRVLFSIIIFIFGFVSIDVLLNFKRKKQNLTIEKVDSEKQKKTNLWFLFGVIIYVAYIMYKIIFTNSAEMSYQIRSGESESNLMRFFVFNIMEAIKFSIIITLLICKQHKKLALFLIFVISSLFILSSGRLNLLLNILIVMFLFVRIRSPYISVLMFFALLVGLPLLFSLKSIIYNVSINGAIGLSDLTFKLNLDDYLRNFGHPLFSYLNVERLIDNIGYRYFLDYLQGFAFYLKLIGLDFGYSITYLNTEALMGVKESIVPPGYFAFGYAQLAEVGILLAGATYRVIGKLGEYFYKLLFNEKNNVAEFYIAFICANTFYHGDFRIFVMSIFFPFVFCCFFCKVAMND